jgi:hypothetical protein
VLFHPSIGLGFNRGQQKQFAEPDIIISELKRAFGDSTPSPGDGSAAITYVGHRLHLAISRVD